MSPGFLKDDLLLGDDTDMPYFLIFVFGTWLQFAKWSENIQLLTDSCQDGSAENPFEITVNRFGCLATAIPQDPNSTSTVMECYTGLPACIILKVLY